MLYASNKFVSFTACSLRHPHISAGEQATNSLLRLRSEASFFSALGQPSSSPLPKQQEGSKCSDLKRQNTNITFNPLGG